MSENLSSKSTNQLVNMFEDTKPLEVEGDIEKRKAIMAILEKRNPSMYFEWVSSEHDSPRGYFLHGNAATAQRRPTPVAADALRCPECQAPGFDKIVCEACGYPHQ